MKWSTSFELTEVNVEMVRSALPLFGQQVRELQLVEQCVLDPASGERLERLRHVAGVHGKPGAVYEGFYPARHVVPERLPDGSVKVGPRTFDADDPRNKAFMRGAEDGVELPERTEQFELRADDAGRWEVTHKADTGEPAATTVTVNAPFAPDRIEVEFHSNPGRSFLTRGVLEFTGEVDLARLAEVAASGASGRSIANGRVRHRRLRALVSVDVEPGSAAWTVSVDAKVQLRGVLRPFSAFIRFAVRRAFDDAMSDLDEAFEPWVLRVNNAPSPDALAATWLGDALASYRDDG